mmetsp:Transcript_14169/g.31342  ORF Transcript_14169/g.31342 Transcript_14169/m.31342 type:complete len:95 (+) Transcript_14169:211-495(+)
MRTRQAMKPLYTMHPAHTHTHTHTLTHALQPHVFAQKLPSRSPRIAIIAAASNLLSTSGSVISCGLFRVSSERAFVFIGLLSRTPVGDSPMPMA